MLHRRQALISLATAAATPWSLFGAEQAGETRRTALGLVSYCCGLQRQAELGREISQDLFEPRVFLEHCEALGSGGMQVSLGIQDRPYCQALRQCAEQLDMFIEAIVRVPENEGDVDRFAAEIQTAASCGALAARTTVFPGRRYEFFDSLETYREYVARGRRSLQLAVPVVEQHRVRLAVENHKDQRSDERIRLFEQISSAYVGACVDTGNSLALLESPLDTIRALAPWAHAVHLKDQAVRPYEDGFLLGDIPLGQGDLPLKEIVQILRTTKSDIRFCLELITRDPLRVPVLNSSYWATFPDLPASELARALRFVHDHSNPGLQQVSQLGTEAQIALERANVHESLVYAREQLRL